MANHRVDSVYFGCWDRPGHYFHSCDGGYLYPHEGPLTEFPWGYEVDGGLCPGGDRRDNRVPQVEGEALIHHKDGWTALSFWDRSVDARGGCNSNFFFRGILSFDEALVKAKKVFPFILARFTFDVRESRWSMDRVTPPRSITFVREQCA